MRIFMNPIFSIINFRLFGFIEQFEHFRWNAVHSLSGFPIDMNGHFRSLCRTINKPTHQVQFLTYSSIIKSAIKDKSNQKIGNDEKSLTASRANVD